MKRFICWLVGHDFDPTDTYVTKHGRIRFCLRCRLYITSEFKRDKRGRFI